DDEQKHVTRIGSGRYCTAWKNGNGDVWLQVHEKDYSKDILAQLPDNPHLPKVESIGWFDGRAPYRLYKSVEYRPLTAKCKEAWKMYKALHEAWVKCRFSTSALQTANKYAQDVNEQFRSYVDAFFPDTPILNAVDSLIDESYNYDSYCIEITKKNCAVDDK